MITIQNILIAIISLLHFYIMIIEMFFWDKPKGIKAFGLEPEFAKMTKVMAANQGLYNGFIAAGLLFSIASPLYEIKLFFLMCVFVAGIFGGLTFNRKILVIQSVPAFFALLAVIFNF